MNKFYSREHRQRQIMHELALGQMQGRPAHSMRQLARKLDMAPSNHLMGILWAMVDQNLIVATPHAHQGATVVRWSFEIAPHKYRDCIGDVYKEFDTQWVQIAVRS